MLKKFVSAAAALCLLVVAAVPAALAAEVKSSFSDMSADNYGWAVEDVESMTRLGIIKGYTDGTFKPANPIKKIEMLLLLARVAGYSNAEFDPYSQYAAALYAPVLADYDMSYKSEVSFLLYRGILAPEELDGLLAQSTAPVKRYEAAVLLTKLMGAEDQVRRNIAASLDYADYSDIPPSARTYVEYVTNQGIMTGTGDNNFSPMNDISRAQAAVILSRVITRLNHSTVYGTVAAVDAAAGTITIRRGDNGVDVTVRPDAKTRITVDGSVAAMAALNSGNRVIALYSGSTLIEVDALTSVGTAYSGTLTDAEIEEENVTLHIEDASTGEERLFTLVTSDAVITLDGKACTFNDLHKGLFAVVTANEDKIITLAASTSTPNPGGKITGIIADIQLTPEYILSIEGSDGEYSDYNVATRVSVTRNGSAATLRDLLVGDKVAVTEEDGVLTSIEATSTSSTASGVITSITIEAEPKLTLRSGEDEEVYSVASNAEITIDGNAADLYDLRLGSFVNLELDSSRVVLVNVISDSTSSTFQLSGYIADFNLSYGYVNIETDEDVEHVLMNMSGDSVMTAIINASNGDRMDASDLEAGQRVTVIGVSFNGTRTANTIVVIPE